MRASEVILVLEIKTEAGFRKSSVSFLLKADEVGMNNKVEVWFEEDDETETYKIVTTMRQDSLKGLISGESPLGKALLGHKVGDRVFVEIGGGDGYYVVIRSIDKSAGDDDELRSF